jgi:hypothetical protein
MLEALLLLLAASSCGWALINAKRGERPVAVGAAVTSTMLGVAFAGTTLPVMAWIEGGFGMNVLALPGGYALGAAAAFLLSGKPKAKGAAFIAAGVTAALSVFFYVNGLREMDEVLRQVTDLHDAELIREGSRGELLRLLELGGVLITSTALLLGIGGRRPPLQRIELLETARTR